jgi:hypothetical protein
LVRGQGGGQVVGGGLAVEFLLKPFEGRPGTDLKRGQRLSETLEAGPCLGKVRALVFQVSEPSWASEREYLP